MFALQGNKTLKSRSLASLVHLGWCKHLSTGSNLNSSTAWWRTFHTDFNDHPVEYRKHMGITGIRCVAMPMDREGEKIRWAGATPIPVRGKSEQPTTATSQVSVGDVGHSWCHPCIFEPRLRGRVGTWYLKVCADTPPPEIPHEDAKGNKKMAPKGFLP